MSKLKLEVGKYYRTRDGRKAGPVRYSGFLDDYPFSARIDDDPFATSFAVDGRYNLYGPSSRDLVSELVEGVVPRTGLVVTPWDITDEQVVARFNELVKQGRVQFRMVRGVSGEVVWAPQDAEQRLKPTTRRTTLPDSGYEVVVEGETVKVRCQEFDVFALKYSLRDLIAKGGSNRAFVATRKGIRYQDYTITWNDADKLLSFLEEK